MSTRASAVWSPSPTAGWLVAGLTWLLPPGSRIRYVEEFLGELREIAEQQPGHRPQILHALRLTSRIWALRRALPPPPGGVRAEGRVVAHAPAEGPRSVPWATRLHQRIDSWVSRWDSQDVIRQQALEQRRYGTSGRVPVSTRAVSARRRPADHVDLFDGG